MKINAFITHKKAEHFIDCQDRFSVNIDTKSFAVSDGMGSTWQQKIWARLLAETFTNDNQWFPNEDAIHNLSQKWREEVQSFIEELQKQLDSPNCLETEKKLIQSQIFRNQRNLKERKSAGATLVGVRILSDDKCNATVLGDSCLIVWDGATAEFLTSQEGQEFDSYPDYFDSDPFKKGKGKVKEQEYCIGKYTCLLLVSDPFSEFLWSKNKEENIKVYIEELINVKSHEEFEILVSKWRELGMNNDDTTAIIVSLDKSKGLQKGVVDNIEDFISLEKQEKKSKNNPTTALQQTTTIPNTEKNSTLTEINSEDLSILIYSQCKDIWSKEVNHNIFKHIIKYIKKSFCSDKTNKAKEKFEDITINCIKEVLKDFQIFKKS